MLYAAAIVHGGWALMLAVNADPLGCTPMAYSPFRHDRWQAAVMYAVASVAALVALHWGLLERRWPWLSLVLCAPQQLLMLLSAGTAMWCVWQSAYADNEPRPQLFIAADQLWTVIGMIAHSFALWDWHYWSRIKNDTEE